MYYWLTDWFVDNRHRGSDLGGDLVWSLAHYCHYYVDFLLAKSQSPLRIRKQKVNVVMTIMSQTSLVLKTKSPLQSVPLCSLRVMVVHLGFCKLILPVCSLRTHAKMGNKESNCHTSVDQRRGLCAVALNVNISQPADSYLLSQIQVAFLEDVAAAKMPYH